MKTLVRAVGKYVPADDYTLEGGMYEADRSPALQLWKNGEKYATLTCCVPDHTLAHGEVLIKTWSENEGVAESLINNGVLEDTGRRVAAGFCEAMVCRLLIPLEG